ncbi:pectate lyase family protein [Tabrizicola sp.]|uniref:pectate lyase family protein n=1 Tax=Tabrizicola sp. TaxID=2005166 RepID=UPI003F41B391
MDVFTTGSPAAFAQATLRPRVRGPEKKSEPVVRRIPRFATAVLMILLAAAAPAKAEIPTPPAFPGAMGFGAVTAGGRGGPVIRVTNLERGGKGSLAWALSSLSGPRIVVFEVGGIIKLRDEIRVNGEVTVLGQTAPGEGITIEGGRLVVVGDDVIIRGIHFRPGTGKGQDRTARDGISIGSKGQTVRRVIVDRNSIMWATDENASTWYTVEDVTYSNNIIAEGLLNAGHADGRHSMGMLIGQKTNRISILRNAFFSNYWRNPQIEETAAAEVINNLIYNYGPGGIQISKGPSRVDVIGNVMVAGPNTPDVDTRPAISLEDASPGAAYFLKDNLTPLGIDVASGDGVAFLAASPLVAPESGTPVLPSHMVKSHVLAEAGARVPALDRADQRILDSLSENTGRTFDGSWHGRKWRPPEAKWPKSRDGDRDGLPDDEEARLGTDPEVADSERIDPVTGYAYIELYANGLFER